MRLLPAIAVLLDKANIGGQVSFHGRKYIAVTTRVEAPARLKQKIEDVVADNLGWDLFAKVSLTFAVGEIRRAGGMRS